MTEEIESTVSTYIRQNLHDHGDMNKITLLGWAKMIAVVAAVK